MTTNPNLLKRGDVLKCSMGTAPGTFRSFTENGNAQATDTNAFVNIPTFGMCRSMANPAVAAASAAAQGVMTPGVCVPSAVGTWVGGAMDNPAEVGATAVCHCTSGGTISRIG